ncbi:hypothetical protein [Tritonibacter mobilis]|jgi:hypothetical protein|uniref:hypothetical protein n=1 Tax=Tritonibacter mobilis TaxID=379347 RepID=UPI003A5BDFA0
MTRPTQLEPNVITEQGLRELAEKGHGVEVLCQTDPERKGPSWYGRWIMRTIGADGKEKLLVTARTRLTQNSIKVREFKTATGVISFLIGIGFDHADIPLREGETTLHKLLNG